MVARDRGTSQPLSSRSVIEVSVEDVNDNAPKFEVKNLNFVGNFWNFSQFSSYDLYVPENAPAGTLVGQLRAEDPDQGENGRIQFRIFGGPDAKLFELDGDQQGEPQVESGNIGIKQVVLFREPSESGPGNNSTSRLARTSSRWNCKRAGKLWHFAKRRQFRNLKNHFSSQLSTTVPVRVHVLDTNDHPPQLADPFVVLVAIFMGDTETEKAQTNLTIGQVPAL